MDSNRGNERQHINQEKEGQITGEEALIDERFLNANETRETSRTRQRLIWSKVLLRLQTLNRTGFFIQSRTSLGF